MSPVKRYIARNMISLLSTAGAHRMALRWVDSLLASGIALNQLRLAVSIAKRGGFDQLVIKYAREATHRFPDNSFGYIEQSLPLIAEGRISEAEALLMRAPSSRATKSALASIYKLSGSPKSPSVAKKKSNSKARRSPPVATINLLESALAAAGSNINRLLAVEQQARFAIAMRPEEELNYSIMLKVLDKLKRYAEVIEFICSMPPAISKKIGVQLLLATTYQVLGQHLRAYEVLQNAQIEHPSDRRLLMRISNVLRDDAQPLLAYSYLRAARACYPEYGAVRQLSFEIDHQQLVEAQATFVHVLTYPTIDLLKFLPMINRAAPLFPQHRAAFQAARLNVRQLLDAETGRKGINPSDQLRVAVKCRWLEVARHIVQRARKGPQPVADDRILWLKTVVDNMADHRMLFDVASINEDSDELYGVYRSAPLLLSESNCSLANTIEVFIPTVFFADPDEEKSSYATVRAFLSAVFDCLKSRNDLILIPRHQWNWRYCDPRVKGAKVISYHTHGPFNPDHLHIQELALAGRCSMDHQGFAGYSSLAKDFDGVRDYSKNQQATIQTDTLDVLAQQYISNNISKYGQTEVREQFEGDYVFVALQIPTDTVASLAYIDGVSLVSAVARYYKGTQTKVVVKRHPYCNSKSVELCLKELEESASIVLSSASVHDIISNARVVYTVNSGVGLEALLHKKPVVVTGECDYVYAVSAQAKTMTELNAVFNQEPVFDNQRASEFLHYYVNIYSAQADDASAICRKLNSWLN